MLLFASFDGNRKRGRGSFCCSVAQVFFVGVARACMKLNFANELQKEALRVHFTRFQPFELRDGAWARQYCTVSRSCCRPANREVVERAPWQLRSAEEGQNLKLGSP